MCRSTPYRSRPVTDEKQKPTTDPVKQRAAEIAADYFCFPYRPYETGAIERALREGMAMRVPDELLVSDTVESEDYCDGWNACRAAMLARNGE